MTEPIQEIKAKLSIEDIVAPYVQLKRSGRYLKACCPFHQEKTPSFYVSPEKQLAYCFACHKGGDLFQFIQDIEGVDFRGALEFLAEKAQVDLPKFRGGARPVSKDFKDKMKAVSADASKFFVQKLWEKGDGEKVVAYLKNRGLTEKTIREFEVGFALEEKDMLYRNLLEAGHEKADILASTVVLARDSEGHEIVDRFKLRLMIPIENSQGEVVAFGGRALKKGVEPKYLNSADNELYHKSAILYNFSRAKKSIREQDFVVVVEGYLDVMASFQAGVENTVATCGTALTEEQVKLLKRVTKKIAFAFDSDTAGEAALLRAIEIAQPFCVELFVILISTGKDAAEVVQEDPKLWVKAVSEKKSYLEYFLQKVKEGFDFTSAKGKREATDFFLGILKGVVHPVELDHYLKEFSLLVGTPVTLLLDYLKQLKVERKSRVIKAPGPSAPTQGRKERLVQYFLSLLLAFPQVFFKHFEKLGDFPSFERSARNLGLIKPFNKLDPKHYEAFYMHFSEQLGNESSVYKQIQDYYNISGTVDDEFFSGLDRGVELQKLAFEAEVNNSDPAELPHEFEKVLTLLYFESLSPLA